jgi:hypothetical protein
MLLVAIIGKTTGKFKTAYCKNDDDVIKFIDATHKEVAEDGGFTFFTTEVDQIKTFEGED